MNECPMNLIKSVPSCRFILLIPRSLAPQPSQDRAAYRNRKSAKEELKVPVVERVRRHRYYVVVVAGWYVPAQGRVERVVEGRSLVQFGYFCFVLFCFFVCVSFLFVLVFYFYFSFIFILVFFHSFVIDSMIQAATRRGLLMTFAVAQDR